MVNNPYISFYSSRSSLFSREREGEIIIKTNEGKIVFFICVLIVNAITLLQLIDKELARECFLLLLFFFLVLFLFNHGKLFRKKLNRLRVLLLFFLSLKSTSLLFLFFLPKYSFKVFITLVA